MDVGKFCFKKLSTVSALAALLGLASYTSHSMEKTNSEDAQLPGEIQSCILGYGRERFNTLSLVCSNWKTITDKLTSYVKISPLIQNADLHVLNFRFSNLVNLDLGSNMTINLEGLFPFQNLKFLNCGMNQNLEFDVIAQLFQNLTRLRMHRSTMLLCEGSLKHHVDAVKAIPGREKFQLILTGEAKKDRIP